VETVTASIEVGQVWKDLDPDQNNRTVRIENIIDGGERVEVVIEEGGANDGKTVRLSVEALQAGKRWRLVRNADGTVPESGLDDAFATVNEREGDRMNQLLLFGTPEFIVDSVGLSKHGQRITIAGAERTRDVLLKVHSGTPYYLGDLDRIVESELGEEASQVLDAEAYERFGVSDSTRKTYRWVADRVPDENRRIAPSFGHAQAVAALRPDQQRKFLEEARAEDWSVAKLKTQVAASTEEGKSRLRFLIIVDAQTEHKQAKLVEYLEGEGFKCTIRTAVKRTDKKPKREKKQVTAKRRTGAKINQRRKK
jgi:Family of unknown function (DUF6354)